MRLWIPVADFCYRFLLRILIRFYSTPKKTVLNSTPSFLLEVDYNGSQKNMCTPGQQQRNRKDKRSLGREEGPWKQIKSTNWSIVFFAFKFIVKVGKTKTFTLCEFNLVFWRNWCFRQSEHQRSACFLASMLDSYFPIIFIYLHPPFIFPMLNKQTQMFASLQKTNWVGKMWNAFYLSSLFFFRSFLSI